MRQTHSWEESESKDKSLDDDMSSENPSTSEDVSVKHDGDTITVKSTRTQTTVEKETTFSDVSDNKVYFSDFYHDARSFLDKTNSTKFILLVFLMITIPLLLVTGYIQEDVYQDMVLVIALCYLGVDVYEKKSLIRR